MVNTQQILDQKHPNKETPKELDLSNQGLDGSLIIQDFPNLEVIKCGNNKGLNDINLSNLPKLRCFHANGCQLTDLKVNECPNINNFNVANNLLTSSDFLKAFNPEKLIYLSIHSNNLQEKYLTTFSDFINLKSLFIDNNDQKKFSLGIYNRFAGSLKPLKNLNNLEYLNIANTDIDSGLEFLSKEFKKIGLVNSWERKDAGYLDLKWELERSIRFPEVTEKLQQQEVNEPSFVKNWYRLTPWKKAKQIRGEDAFKRHDAQEWLNDNYPVHTNRQHYNEINISDKNLIEELDLSDFTNLEQLDCSYNQLTTLILVNCSNLSELNCSNNEFADLDFLNQIPNKEKLEKLNLSNNQEFQRSLDFLTSFTNLKELNLSNCSFSGSLKPLETLKNLRTINISHTDISGGLNYLPDSCRELYCELNERRKSSEITNILTKYFESNGGYYNLAKWRDELRNNIISSIPTERLFVIRSNIKKFVDKWSKEPSKKKWSGKKFFKYILNEKEFINKLDELQSPKQFKNYQNSTYFQYGSYITTTIGGILTLLGKTNNRGELTTVGGIISISSPIVSVIATKVKESFYDSKQKKWDEFTQDCNELLDNYHELLGILESLQGYKIGILDQTIRYLDNKSKEFLKEYDEDKNGTIDVSELQEKKNILSQDLTNKETTNSQLGEIFQNIKKLEEEINKYQRGFFYGREEIKRDSYFKQMSDIVSDLAINEEADHDQQCQTIIEAPLK